jgi:hypothetical protein
MPKNWVRLERQEAHDVIGRLSGQRDAVLFSKDTTEVVKRDIPFYPQHQLFRLTNYATLPTFTLTYLSDGSDFIALNGTANPIYTVNEKAPLALDETNIIPYLDFFFSNVQGSEGDVFIIKDPRKMPFMDSFTQEQQSRILGTFKPLTVAADAERHGFVVTGTIYYGGGLLAATLFVTAEGKLSFLEQNMLLSGIHFPPSPYSQSWLEG